MDSFIRNVYFTCQYMMATVDETVGLIKGLAEVVKPQQLAQTQAYKETTEQLQQLSSTVEALSKSILPQALHGNDALGLRLPNATLPVFTGRENLDRFIEQITNLLRSSGVSPRFWVTYLKQQTQKHAQAYHALIQAEKTHQNVLAATPYKASPSESGKYFGKYFPVWKRYVANAGNRVIDKSANCYISITQCDRTTTNLLQTSEIVSPKFSLNWKSWFRIYIDAHLQWIAQTFAVNLNLFTPL